MASPRVEPHLQWNQGPGNVGFPLGMAGELFPAPYLLGLALGAYVAGRRDGARSRPASKKRSRSRSGLALSIIASDEADCAPPGKRTPKDMTPRRGAQGQGAEGGSQGGTPQDNPLCDTNLQSEDLVRLLSATLKENGATVSSAGPVLKRRVRFVTELGAHLDPAEAEQMLEHGPPVALWMAGEDAARQAEEGAGCGWLDFTVAALDEMFDADWERNVHRHDVDNVRVRGRGMTVALGWQEPLARRASAIREPSFAPSAVKISFLAVNRSSIQGLRQNASCWTFVSNRQAIYLAMDRLEMAWACLGTKSPRKGGSDSSGEMWPCDFVTVSFTFTLLILSSSDPLTPYRSLCRIILPQCLCSPHQSLQQFFSLFSLNIFDDFFIKAASTPCISLKLSIIPWFPGVRGGCCAWSQDVPDGVPHQDVVARQHAGGGS